jgi:hypothetical protein
VGNAPAPVHPEPSPSLALVEQRLAAVEERLLALAGNQSLCELSKAGAPGGVKELEGRSAALRDARRALRGADHREAAAAVAVVADAWRAQLAADERRGPVWVRYRTGGLDELERLAAGLLTA